MFVTNWISTTKIQKISEITNFFRHYFLSRTEVNNILVTVTTFTIVVVFIPFYIIIKLNNFYFPTRVYIFRRIWRLLYSPSDWSMISVAPIYLILIRSL